MALSKIQKHLLSESDNFIAISGKERLGPDNF